MDRRSLLWHRKSLEKCSGETESSGSISSHSERFSDDQAYSSYSTQLPEVSSKALRDDEELHETLETLKDKLSAALRSCIAKEELVKQHAKVAEEAVSGWEMAGNEVLGLKQKLEAANQKNSALKDRVGHLDGALKECVRQLRQAREEQERNITEAVTKKTREWDSSKFILESQLADLQAQVQDAKTEAAASVGLDLHNKLDCVQTENSALQLSLHSQVKELEIRTIERDLSTQAAEAASKQHLESIKKIVKLEAECRRLKALARKALPDNGHKSSPMSSVYVEYFTDSQSDSRERVMPIEFDTHTLTELLSTECESSQSGTQASVRITGSNIYKNMKGVGKNVMVPSVEINLMDDFLEMEKFAASPITEDRNFGSNQPAGGRNLLETELEAMKQRIAELEGKLEKMVAEKETLEMTLNEYQKEIQSLKSQLLESGLKLEDLQIQLDTANGSKLSAEEEVKAYQTMREVTESKLRSSEAELNFLLSKVGALEEDISKARALSSENVAKCKKLENELSKMKHEAELHHLGDLTCTTGHLKIQQEKELALAASKFAECQKTIASLGQQLKSLASLEDILMDSDIP